MSKVQGGKFASGFLGSAFAASTKGVNFKVWDKTLQYKVHRVITAGIIGGTASALGGGKFANGVASAMFTQLYNAETTNAEQQANTQESNTYLAGVGGSVVVIYGFEGSFGALMTPGDFWDFDIGVFYSYGDGIGLNVSADLLGGVNEGDVYNLRGETTNLNVVVGPVSITTVVPSGTTSPSGATVGTGPSLTTFAGSITSSTTKAYSRQTIINDLADGMCNFTGKC